MSEQPSLLQRLARVPGTSALILTLLVLYAAEVARMGGTDISAQVATEFGANSSGHTAQQPWRLVTSAFLHFSLIHVLFNGYALWIVGGILEQTLGARRMLTLFFLFAVGGDVLGTAWWEARRAGVLPGVAGGGAYASAGASGAVCGLIAYGAIYTRRHAEARRYAGALRTWLLFIAVFSVAVPRVDAAGHLGGAIVGALGSLSVNPAPKTEAGVGWTVSTALSAALCAVAFALIAADVRLG